MSKKLVKLLELLIHHPRKLYLKPNHIVKRSKINFHNQPKKLKLDLNKNCPK